MLLLNAKLTILAICDQRTRDIPKCVLNGLLVSKDHLLALGLRKTNVGLEPASLGRGFEFTVIPAVKPFIAERAEFALS